MLACGCEPNRDSAADVNWHFRIQPRLLRAALGQRGLGGLRVSFGAMLRHRREAAGIGLRELAPRIEITPTYLSKIEHNEFRSPAEDKVVAIARELNIDPDILSDHAKRVATDGLADQAAAGRDDQANPGGLEAPAGSRRRRSVAPAPWEPARPRIAESVALRKTGFARRFVAAAAPTSRKDAGVIARAASIAAVLLGLPAQPNTVASCSDSIALRMRGFSHVR